MHGRPVCLVCRKNMWRFIIIYSLLICCSFDFFLCVMVKMIKSSASWMWKTTFFIQTSDWILYSCEQKHVLLFRKSEICLFKVSITKGQLISECLLGVIDFPKNQRKIWQISALESKKWSNQQSKSTFL